VTKAGFARNPRNKETITARSPAHGGITQGRRSQRKAGSFFICHALRVITANEKAALSKTVSRFWTIDLLRAFHFANLAAGLPRASRGSKACHAFLPRFIAWLAWFWFFVTGFQE